MSRLTDKIKNLEEQISELQGQLESAEDRLRRQNFKRNRKAFRKKMISDPMFRIAARLERDMYTSCIDSNPPGSIIEAFSQIVK